jgi:chromosome segregation ATPase
MTRMILVVLCLLLLASCGGSDSQVAELEKKNADLTQRVQNLENNLLAAEKKLIVHEQAMQTLNSRMREVDNLFAKLQSGSTR